MTDTTNPHETNADEPEATPETTAESMQVLDAVYPAGRGYTVGSFVMAVLALLVIPPLHGVIGAVLGYVGHRKGDALGRTAMVASLLAMVVGSMVALLAFRSVT